MQIIFSAAYSRQILFPTIAIGSPRAITRVVKDIKKMYEQSSSCIERIQALEFSRNTRLTSITRGRGRTGGRLMPPNSPPRIEIPSKSLGYDASQIVHGCVYRASYRRFARPTRTCRASHMLYRFDSFVSVYVFPRDYRRMPGRNGVIRKRDVRRRYRRRIARVLSRSAYVLASSGVHSCSLHLGIHNFRCEREFECSGHRIRWNVACAEATGARRGLTTLTFKLWLSREVRGGG